MNKNRPFKMVVLALLLVVVNGCVNAVEVGKTFYGSSTRMLEGAKKDALSKSYECQYNDCFGAVIKILEENEARVLIKDKLKNMIVAMEIKRCVTTTEAGIFFIEEKPNKVKIEVSSLSPKAKRITSEFLFPALDALYNVDDSQRSQ